MKIPASIWFPHADKDASVREMKIQSEQYEYVITLLILSRKQLYGPPFHGENE
ncbi:Uncharacterised protein [Escherichia coli]|uniref:Uncharacterized protein n=1 Tax=Escherichia coli TaxID=562 RepID=A0A377F533_ECOLX|nr:Uncharacterised protein [Escherichia coli]